MKVFNRADIEKLDDAKLAEFKSMVDKNRRDKILANAASTGILAGDMAYRFVINSEGKATVNAEHADEMDEESKKRMKGMLGMDENELKNALGRRKALNEFDDDDLEEECNRRTKNKRMAAKAAAKNMKDEEEEEEYNRKAKNKRATANMGDWEASLPVQAREVWESAKRVDREAKAKLVSRLAANIQDDERRDKMTRNLMGKGLAELEDLVALIPAPRQQSEPNYYAQVPAYALTDNEQKDVLDLESARADWDRKEKARTA